MVVTQVVVVLYVGRGLVVVVETDSALVESGGALRIEISPNSLVLATASVAKNICIKKMAKNVKSINFI